MDDQKLSKNKNDKSNRNKSRSPDNKKYKGLLNKYNDDDEIITVEKKSDPLISEIEEEIVSTGSLNSNDEEETNPIMLLLSKIETIFSMFEKKEPRKYALYFIGLEDNNMFLYLSYKKEKEQILYECQHLYDYPKLYRPKDIVFTMDDCELTDADNYVKIFMKMFGEDTVRGGSYTDIILPEWQKKTLDLEFETATIEKLDENEKVFESVYV